MKTSVVPAQVTSVEDTITANLTLTQIILLIIPVFVCAVLFAVMPPLGHVSITKVVASLVLSLPFVVLALKVKGALVLHWLRLVLSFHLRPRLYLNTVVIAQNKTNQAGEEEPALSKDEQTGVTKQRQLYPDEIARIASVLTNKKVVLRPHKGGFSAVIEAK